MKITFKVFFKTLTKLNLTIVVYEENLLGSKFVQNKIICRPPCMMLPINF